MKRRSVIAGLGALAAAGCSRGPPIVHAFMGLSKWEEDRGARMGFFAMQGRSVAEWRATERFTFCSTFKLFLAAATLERVQRGEERLDRLITVSESDLVAHAPVTGEAVGNEISVETLCQGMVELSDNPAANILIREMGGLDMWRTWHQQALNDMTTSVDRLEPELNLINGEMDTTTPLQAVLNMRTLLGPDQRRLSPGHKELLSRWLENSPTGPNRIKAGAPRDATVGHKTGTSGQGMVNDIGVIWPTEGEPIFVAAYYSGPETDGPEWGEPAIAEATFEALEAFGHG